jgi:hypothetical protein
MTTMRNYLTIWLAGLIAGLILMERWQSRAEELEPAASATNRSDGDVAPPVEPAAPKDSANLVELVVTGARLDVQSVRQWVSRTSTSRIR